MDVPFRIALAIILVAFVGHRAYYTRKYPAAAQETVVEQTERVSEILPGILAIAGLLGTLLYLFVPTLVSWAAVTLPAWLRWAGVVTSGAGFGLLQWSQAALGANWSDRPRITQEQALVTLGPYRWIRHPIYSAFLLILGSSLLISANWFLGGVWIGMTLLSVMSRIRFEEHRMAERFGERYLAYQQRTGRLLPRL